MSVYPTDITRTENGLCIAWSDSTVSDLTARQLRDACPCATCREKRRASDAEEGHVDLLPNKKAFVLPVLSVQETQPILVRGMKPIGNYAYNITFSDGHNSGLFTFDFLRSLPTRHASRDNSSSAEESR